MTARERAASAAKGGLILQERKRQETGKPEPTAHDRRLRRARNKRYFQNLKLRQQAAQQKAA
jgi:hypothetical protein